MKKILSLVIVLILAFSLCSVCVAFADGGEVTPREPVTFDEDKFWELVNNAPMVLERGTKCVSPFTKEQVLGTINNFDESATETSKKDQLYIFLKSETSTGDWIERKIDAEFTLNAERYVMKYVVKYKDTDGTEKEAHSPVFYRIVEDTKAPELKPSAAVDTEPERAMEAGKAFSISTSYVNKTDSSSTPTVTFLIYKDSNKTFNKETATLVYDSVTKINAKVDENGEVLKDEEGHIVEDYSSFVANGKITPLESDINSQFYHVVYTVADEMGNTSELTLTFSVKAAVVEEEDEVAKNKVETWKIILWVVAFLCFVGIVVLLFVRPKEAVAEVAADAEVSIEENDVQK